MEFIEFYEYAQKTFERNVSLPELTEETAKKLFLLTKHMLEVNKSLNLTAIKDEKSIILKHYADSLTISGYIKPNSKLIDVGCGAGFPTLPLAIFRPDVRITAIDGTAKRIDYVALTAKMLGLENVTAMAARAEELANDKLYRESFDYATARAVATLPILTELCLPFVRVGGVFIGMKAQKGADEVACSHNAMAKCGGKLDKCIETLLKDREDNTETRTLVIVSKIERTPKEFPRHYSKISKKPL